jgi:hypothetical protein
MKNISMETNQNEKDLIREVDEYLRFMNNKSIEQTQIDNEEKLNPDAMYLSLRNQERVENDKLVLQYLLTFLKAAPSTEQLKQEPVNPFDQFKTFVLFQIRLLQETDVVKAIIRDGQESKSLGKWNEYYWRIRISQLYQKAMDLIREKQCNTIEDCINCFYILQDICQLWFDIRYKNGRPIRPSDIITFKLTKVLLNRISNQSSQLNQKQPANYENN